MPPLEPPAAGSNVFSYAGAEESARRVVPVVMEFVQARSAIDIGCGHGAWLSVLREHGVEDVLGVDAEGTDRGALRIPADRFVAHDLSGAFGSDRVFDLVVSLEVAEHLPATSAELFVDSLTRLGPVVLFSAAIPGQGGLGHLNEQWPRYWVDRFRARGYVAIDCLRHRIWDDDGVDWWYAQNLLFFVAQDRLAEYPRLAAEAKNGRPPIALVHPRLFAQLVDRPTIASLRQVLRALPRLIGSRIRREAQRMSRPQRAEPAPGGDR